MDRRDFLIGMAGLFITAAAPFGLDSKKRIYLTVDDCPRQYMDEIIDVLGDNKATFFCVGEYLRGKEEVALKALRNGHLIGNHSYDHPRFSSLDFDKAKQEVLRTEELIDKLYEEVGIPNPKLFRFPYGIRCSKKNELKLDELLVLDEITPVDWNLDLDNYRYVSKVKPVSLEHVMKLARSAKDKDIVLCHDLEITARHIVPYYVNSGEYEFLLL